MSDALFVIIFYCQNGGGWIARGGGDIFPVDFMFVETPPLELLAPQLSCMFNVHTFFTTDFKVNIRTCPDEVMKRNRHLYIIFHGIEIN